MVKPPDHKLFDSCPNTDACPSIDSRLHHLWHEGELEECARAYRKIIELCPNCPHANIQLAGCLSSVGEPSEADRFIEDLLTRAENPSELSTLLSHKGSMLLESGLGDEAELWLLEAASIDEYSGNKATLAVVLWRNRRRRAAIELARDVMNDSPHDPASISTVARILVRANEQEFLGKALMRLAKEPDRLPHYYIRIAVWLVEAGRTAAGIALARRAARKYTESLAVTCIASHLLIDSSYDRDAQRVLRRLLKLDPVGHGKYSLISLATLAGRRNDVEALLRYATRADGEFHDADTARLLKRATRTVLSELRGDRKELKKVKTQYSKISLAHQSLSESLAGYDLTEGGTNLEWALSDGEGWHIEFKASIPGNVRDLAVEMAALSSQDGGGTIFIGVDDDGTIVGVPDAASLKDRDAWRHRIAQIATKTVQPPNPVTVYFNQRDEKDIIKIWVPGGSAPIYYVDSIPYIRNIDESRKATHQEVAEYHARRGTPESPA